MCRTTELFIVKQEQQKSLQLHELLLDISATRWYSHYSYMQCKTSVSLGGTKSLQLHELLDTSAPRWHSHYNSISVPKWQSHHVQKIGKMQCQTSVPQVAQSHYSYMQCQTPVSLGGIKSLQLHTVLDTSAPRWHRFAIATCSVRHQCPQVAQSHYSHMPCQTPVPQVAQTVTNSVVLVE